MDSFKEQMIRKVPTGKENALKILIILGASVLAAVMVMFSMMFGMGTIGFALGCGLIYGGFWLLKRYNIEYEYIFTNGDLDVDKIMGASTRKRLITVKIADASDIGVLKSLDSDGRTVVLASANDPSATDYYLDVKHKKHGDVRIIFTPNEDILRIMKPFFPRTMKGKLDFITEKEEVEDIDENE